MKKGFSHRGVSIPRLPCIIHRALATRTYTGSGYRAVSSVRFTCSANDSCMRLFYQSGNI